MHFSQSKNARLLNLLIILGQPFRLFLIGPYGLQLFKLVSVCATEFTLKSLHLLHLCMGNTWIVSQSMEWKIISTFKVVLQVDWVVFISLDCSARVLASVHISHQICSRLRFSGCTGRTRQLPLIFQRAFPICSTCHKATMYREYTDSQLYLQMLYFQHLFQVQIQISYFEIQSICNEKGL